MPDDDTGAGSTNAGGDGTATATDDGQGSTDGNKADTSSQAGEGQTAGDKGTALSTDGEGKDQRTALSTDDGSGDDAGGQKSKAPEKYEKFSVPEGVTFDDSAQEAFGSIARECDLTQEQRQKLVGFQAERMAAAAAEQQRQVTERREGWRRDLDALPEKDKLLGKAKEVLIKFGNPFVKEFFEYSAVGDNPEMVKFLAAIGKAVSEDTFDEGSPPSRGADNLTGQERLAQSYERRLQKKG